MKRNEVIKQIEEIIDNSEIIDEYAKGKNINPCGNCTGCQGNSNYSAFTLQYANFTIEKNSCYKKRLFNKNGKEIGYFNEGLKADEETLEELEEFLNEIEEKVKT